jgi:hypothetical protein
MRITAQSSPIPVAIAWARDLPPRWPREKRRIRDISFNSGKGKARK